jgi:TetR/AcrR family transcriptional repressor of mexJK operon
MQAKDAAGVPITKPFSLRKRKAIVEAAKNAFLEDGYEAANIDLICKEAGVSKRTVYRHFKNKYQLFMAVIQELCESVMPSDEEIKDVGECSQAEYLKWLGINFLSHIYTSERIELYRTIIAEAKHIPEIGVAFFDGPVSSSEKVIYDYLAGQVYQDKMKLKDPKLAASQFIGMLKSDTHMKLLFLKVKRVSLAEIEAIVENTVDLFLYGALRDK